MERDEILSNMDTALEHITRAIEVLSEVEGMEGIVAELEVQAGVLESEIAELDSASYDEPDHGELVEWQDFDPDC